MGANARKDQAKTTHPDSVLPEYRHAVPARDGYMWKGMEFPDPVPVAPPVGYKKQPSIMDNIRELIARASLEAAAQGFETAEEADDFDVVDEFDPIDRGTPWEAHFYPAEPEAPKPAPTPSVAPAAPSSAPSKGDADPPRGGSGAPPGAPSAPGGGSVHS